MVRAAFALVVLALSLALGTPASAASGELPRRIGMYPQQSGTSLAMLDSDITVRIRGPIVEATITQTFKNDSDRVTEATYIFPLPPDAAVTAMSIATDKRTIHAAIEARDKALARYEAAVSAGIGAGLLEQERPDVFTQTVSAIPAHGEVKVTLRFDALAHHAHGTWWLALPLVVAPRYVPGTASGRPTTGSGRAPDTDRAPDASRVTPGGAPGAGGRTDVRIEFTDEVTDVACPTHELSGATDVYTLVDPKTDHDVVLRWRTKVAQQGWVEADGAGGFAAVLVEAKPAPARKTDLELRIVLDRAATTRGDAEGVQRSMIRALLSALKTGDRVGVVGSDTLAAASPETTAKALDDVWRTTAGAFDLTKVLTTLRGSKGPLVLITDGLVADDKPAIAAAAKIGAPLHVIGVGPAPNRNLLVQLAHATNGTVRFALVGDDYAALAKDIIADAAAPPEALAINWGTLSASDVVPAKLPRLGSGQAVLVVARIKKVAKANARARGDVFGFTNVASTTAVTGATSTHGSLARRWAKLKLDDLVAAGATSATIAKHATEYGLVSPATAMVAIGSEVVVEGGVKHTTPVPVSVPAGMQWQPVKKQTTVTTTKTEDRVDVGGLKKPKSRPEPERDLDKDGRGSAGGTTFEGTAGAEVPDDVARSEDNPSPTSTALAPPAPGDYDGEEDEASETLVVQSISGRSRRFARLALSLGGGLARSWWRLGVARRARRTRRSRPRPHARGYRRIAVARRWPPR
jgi:Ca-activated chloride channel homolog